MKVSSPCLSAFLVAALCPSLVVQAQFTLQILHTSDLEGGVDAIVSKWLVDGNHTTASSPVVGCCFFGYVLSNPLDDSTTYYYYY